jgi:hypothetical protein
MFEDIKKEYEIKKEINEAILEFKIGLSYSHEILLDSLMQKLLNYCYFEYKRGYRHGMNIK